MYPRCSLIATDPKPHPALERRRLAARVERNVINESGAAIPPFHVCIENVHVP